MFEIPYHFLNRINFSENQFFCFKNFQILKFKCYFKKLPAVKIKPYWSLFWGITSFWFMSNLNNDLLTVLSLKKLRSLRISLNISKTIVIFYEKLTEKFDWLFLTTFWLRKKMLRVPLSNSSIKISKIEW